MAKDMDILQETGKWKHYPTTLCSLQNYTVGNTGFFPALQVIMVKLLTSAKQGTL